MAMAIFVLPIKGQDAEWEPETKITGYAATEFNYFDELDGYKLNYGVAVPEAGILASYRPTSRITFKTVFVYRPDFTFNQMLNEANVQYQVANAFIIKAGRFLTPLSPMNTYYYAPVNTSATLPVLITAHEFFPLNIDGISLNGTYGDRFRINYDLFAGGYRNTTWLKTGALGFFGDETAYYKRVQNSTNTVDPSYNNTQNLGYGFHVGFSFLDYVTVGASGFKPKDEMLPIYVIPLDVTVEYGAKKFSYGLNFKLKYNNTRLIGEFWKSDLKIDESNVDLNGSFVELSQGLGKFTPYARYEQQHTDDVEFKRYTGGIAFKPMFETTIKVEYMKYDHETNPINGVVASLIYSF